MSTASRTRRARRTRALVCASALSLALPLLAAVPASADTAPTSAATPTTVAADVLPTVQVNGVVWDEVVVGNRVYVTGSFTKARPAGAAAGTNETARSNVLAFDLTTGALITSWTASLNAQGLAIAASADGKRVYVAGDFTQVNGVARSRVAALDATTGALVTGFKADANARVRALAVSGDTLYLGGIFTVLGNQSRTRLAAVSATSGAVTSWAPTADQEVMALVAPAGSGKVVAGGRFSTLNATTARGMGALDAASGATLTWKANGPIQNYGENSAIYSLSTDGTRVYGTGYDYYGPSEFENSFAASIGDGSLTWVAGCLGDTYDSVPVGGVLYTVGHAHNCSPIGGNPESSPRTFQRAMAVTTAAAAGGATNTSGEYQGYTAPELLHWEPDLTPGTFTGQTQAAWSVAAGSGYVVLGGEFPKVNGVAQQGLVRFAVKSTAPNKEGPNGYAELTPTATQVDAGTVRLAWTAAWDRDNRRLTYEVLRGDRYSTAEVVGTVKADSAWWDRKALSVVDRTATPGSTQTYRVRAVDPYGNTMVSTTTQVQVGAGKATPSAYADDVLGAGATSYWRLGEGSGTTAYDLAGSDDLTLAPDASRGTTGAIAGDPSTATTFSGSASVPASTTRSQVAPDTFSVEAWFRTTSTRGGKIVGFGNSSTGLSSSYDRHVYLTNAGKLVFGVYPGAAKAVSSTASYNDGSWHHVVATLGSGGMQLYVDGAQVASRSDVTTAQALTGYWRVGGDKISGNWPSTPTSASLAGAVDEVAVYPSVLSAAQVRAHYATGAAQNQAPAAAISARGAGLQVSFDGSGSSDADGSVASYAWDFGDGSTGSGVSPQHTYAKDGDYTATLTVTDDQGATGKQTSTVRVKAPVANQAPVAKISAAASDLSVSFDGSGSSDADGSVASYAWDFGDGSTASGATASHTYAAAGSYDVALTVTDDGGSTASTSRSVTVTAPTTPTPDPTTPAPAQPGAVASDTFDRSVSGSLGSADVGGTWQRSGAGTTASVSDGSARLGVDPGRSETVSLPGVSAQDVDVVQTLALESASTGGGVYAAPLVRMGASGEYRARLRLQPDGSVLLALIKRIDGEDTFLTSQVTVPGLTYTPGEKLRIRVQAVGSSPTQLRAKVWVDGQQEPSAWQREATDSTTALQGAGAVGLWAYASGSATPPVVVRYDDLAVVTP